MLPPSLFRDVPGALRDPIRQVMLHLGHIDHATLRHFLEFGIVNVSPVNGKDVALVQFSWAKHEMVVCGRRSEFHVTWHALVAMDARMHLHAAFLFPCLGIASHTLEYEVGEEADGRETELGTAVDTRRQPPDEKTGRRPRITGNTDLIRNAESGVRN